MKFVLFHHSLRLLLLVFMSHYYVQAQQKVLSGYTQGTYFLIRYVDNSKNSIEDEVLNCLLEVDSSLSTYIDSSQLMRWNNNETETVDIHILNCYKASKKIYHQSNGAFDPSIFPILNYYGFGPPWLRDTTLSLDSLWECVGLNLVERKGKRLHKELPGIQLDFNALAQGYSVDLVCELFDRNGIHNYLVEIGGEVRAKGVDEMGKDWLVGIESSSDNQTGRNELIDVIALTNRAVATSGNYRKYVESGGTRISHQIDPRSRMVRQSDVISATVIAKNTMLADGYATVFCLLNIEDSKALLSKLKQLEARIIFKNANGTVETYETKHFADYIQ